MRALILGMLALSFDATAGDFSAKMINPTDVYGHRVLGSIVEHKGLEVATPNGVLRYALPDGYVFEDIAPRMHDLDSDGVPEIIIARSKLDTGAALAIYGIADGEIVLRAVTPEIGTRNRWLSIAGAGDLDGDGLANDIAYVETPHLGRVLRIWRFDGEALVNIADAKGHTNHFIGDEVILGGVRNCGTGDQIVTLDPSNNNVIVSRVVDNKIQSGVAGTNVAGVMACAH